MKLLELFVKHFESLDTVHWLYVGFTCCWTILCDFCTETCPLLSNAQRFRELGCDLRSWKILSGKRWTLRPVGGNYDFSSLSFVSGLQMCKSCDLENRCMWSCGHGWESCRWWQWLLGSEAAPENKIFFPFSLWILCACVCVLETCLYCPKHLFNHSLESTFQVNPSGKVIS